MKLYRMNPILLGVSLVAATASSWAQAAPAPKAAPLPPAAGPAASSALPDPKPAPQVNAASYKVGPEDVLSIRVARHTELDTLAQVLDDGSITLPRVGRLVVEGKTVVEVQQLVQQALTKVLRKPEVSVAVQTPRVQVVYVFGEVNKPGPVDYKEGTFRVTEALGRAGGPRLNPNRLTMTLTKKNGGMQTLNPRQIMENADGAENVEVKPGDVLVVGEIPPQPIFVSGAVLKPGMYDLRDVDPTRGSIGVTEALAMAGGASAQAALSQAYVLRTEADGETTTTQPANNSRRQEKVNILALQRAQGLPSTLTLPQPGTPAVTVPETAPAPSAGTSEVLLYPGDTLHIPESKAMFAVTGNVMKPGTFPLSEDRPMTLAEAVSLAGGPDKRAKLQEVGIVRTGDPSLGGQTVIIKADLMALLKRGDARQNPQLQPGDVVYVPESSKPDWFGKILPGIGSIVSTLYLGGLTR